MKDRQQRIGMNRSTKASDVDMTSMVDVTFLLLIFFMVTASFAVQKAIAVPRAQSQLPSRIATDLPPEQAVQVWVDAEGGFHVQTNAGHQTMVGKQALISCLKEAISLTDSQTAVQVFVEDEARLRWLVDAIDAGTSAGSTSITIRQVQSLDAMDLS